MRVTDRRSENHEPVSVATAAPALATHTTAAAAPNVERRTSLRHATSVSIEVSVPHEHRARPHVLRNLSAGGLSYTATRPVKPGTIVSIRFRVSDPAVVLVGQITWCELSEHGYEVGVRFLGGMDAARTRVLDELSEHTTERRAARADARRRLRAERITAAWAIRHASAQPSATAQH